MTNFRGTLSWLFSLALTAGFVGSSRPAEPQEAGKTAAGVVLVEVGAGSAVEKAGLQAGDVVHAWERLPNPPANPRGAHGKIASVFDWVWLVVEQAPRGIVKLTGRRDGEDRVFEILPGEWNVTPRPTMPPEILHAYLKGQELIKAGESETGIDVWHQAARMAENRATEGPLTCWLLLSIGDARGKARQWEKAHDAYRSALETARDPRSRVTVWRTIGLAYYRASAFEKARLAFVSAQEIRESTWGETLAFARGLNDLGAVDHKQDELDSAQGYWQHVLEIRQKLAPGSLDVAWSVNTLGTVAARRGDLDLAAEYFEQALKITERLAPDSLRVSNSLNNLGNVAANRSDWDRASDFHEAALRIKQRLNPGSLDVASSLSNMGNLAALRGDHDKAAEYHEAALEITRESAPGSLAVASSLNSMAAWAYGRGDPDRASEYLDEALEIKRKLAPGGLSLAGGLNNLGRLAADHGELGRAAEYYEEALELARKWSPGSSLEAEVLYGLATVRRRQDQPRAALSLFRQALRALENQVGSLGGSRDIQASFRAERPEYYRDTLDLLLELHQREEAFLILERSRAQSFLTQLAERDLVFTGVPEKLERQRRSIARRYDQTQAVVARLDSRHQNEELEALLARLQRLRREQADVTEKIIKASSRLEALRYPQPLDFAAARKALDPGTVMLSYSVGEKSTEIFVLESDGDVTPLRVERIAIAERDLRSQVRKWSELIRAAKLGDETGALHAARVLGKRLYRQLIQPAADAVAGSQRLLIIPDGPLHVLPWSALIRRTETADEIYLAEWKPLYTALSATVFAQLKQNRRGRPNPGDKPAPVRLAAFGDPLFPGEGQSRGDFRVRSAIDRGLFQGWQSLPYTRREVEQIAALYPTGTTQVYLGAEATEEAAKNVGHEARILHLATHGYIDERSPLDSAVVLTIPTVAAPGRDNGLLQVWEIFEHLRLDADLVVLSACASGAGHEQVGEGLIGLTRAFQYAGARSVMASLWNVQDRATAELMVRFYRHLNAGASHAEALRQAQVEFLRGPIDIGGTSRDYSSPYYWAPFQVYGDWQ